MCVKVKLVKHIHTNAYVVMLSLNVTNDTMNSVGKKERSIQDAWTITMSMCVLNATLNDLPKEKVLSNVKS